MSIAAVGQTPPLLDIRNLSKRFSRTVALDNVSLTIRRGQTLAVVGGSGCGKSTLARLVCGLLEPDSGEIWWEGERIDAWSRVERARRHQMIFQDPYASLNPKLSVKTQLAEVVRSGGASNVTTRCVELLEAVGLSADALGHYPFQFSGGQRQRLAIARALAPDPQLLVADEPLSALDLTTQAQIIQLLGGLKASRHLTLLFITHDLAVADQFADEVVVLKDGRVVEAGPSPRVLRSPTHPYTAALVAAIPRVPC